MRAVFRNRGIYEKSSRRLVSVVRQNKPYRLFFTVAERISRFSVIDISDRPRCHADTDPYEREKKNFRDLSLCGACKNENAPHNRKYRENNQKSRLRRDVKRRTGRGDNAKSSRKARHGERSFQLGVKYSFFLCAEFLGKIHSITAFVRHNSTSPVESIH